MVKKRLGVAAGLGLLLAALAFSAEAANQNGKRSPAPITASSASAVRDGLCVGMMPIMGMMTMMGPSLYNQHTDGCLSAIRTDLKITAAQEPQWTAFSSAIRDNVGTMIDMFESMMMLDDPRATLSERLQFEERTMAQHLASVKRIKQALADLKAVLTAEQTATAKALPFVQ
jgi:LTXXQ motif family protein